MTVTSSELTNKDAHVAHDIDGKLFVHHRQGDLDERAQFCIWLKVMGASTCAACWS